MDYLEVVLHPDLTQEQILGFLEVLGDLFEAAGGKGGLTILEDE